MYKITFSNSKLVFGVDSIFWFFFLAGGCERKLIYESRRIEYLVFKFVITFNYNASSFLNYEEFVTKYYHFF